MSPCVAVAPTIILDTAVPAVELDALPPASFITISTIAEPAPIVIAIGPGLKYNFVQPGKDDL